MDAKTLAALRGSIRKWQGIVAGTIQDHGSQNCPLCKLFAFDGCEGCPVADKVNDTFCDSTPYVEYIETEPYSDEERRLAQVELDFLISLLPEGELP